MGDRYVIERRGGFAGLKASGAVDSDALDPQDRATLDELLASKEPLARDRGADRYTYVVTRQSADGVSTTCQVPESMMPPAVASIVTEQI
ncbi:protealysin inhibitor emfourin [Mycobacterium sp. 852014-50255_SCH5639931]|uniref:protealysin inhibitor emfourin n=1 Tax=Mycobacterium sp. 852014-50255_SCH5639931 TaxID=1834112 RepID=UPI0007FDEE9A|nr:hypothetical protein A5758_16070 [Mycobacterium sp. 852014-50255_SCH5639931]